MNAPTFKDPELDYFQDDAGEWRWRLIASNGEIVASSEGYAGGKEAAERGAKAMLRNALVVASKVMIVLLVAVALVGCHFRVDRSATSGDVVDLRFPAPCDSPGSRGGDEGKGGEAVTPVKPVAP